MFIRNLLVFLGWVFTVVGTIAFVANVTLKHDLSNTFELAYALSGVLGSLMIFALGVAMFGIDMVLGQLEKQDKNLEKQHQINAKILLKLHENP